MNKELSYFVIASLLVLAGCGNDRTPDEANADRNLGDQAQAEQASGTYSGTVYSKTDGKPIGSFSVDFDADTRIAGGDQANVVDAQLTVNDGKNANTIHLADGRFNLVDHEFRIETQISVFSGAQMTTVDIAGSISGDVMVGKIEAANYPTYGGSFRLVKDAPIPTVQATARTTDQGRGLNTATYYGTAKTDESANLSARFEYSPPMRNADQKFLDVFFPIRTGSVTMYLGSSDSPKITFFPQVTWDIRAHTLTGSSTGQDAGQTPYSITMNCTESGTTRRPGWHCDWTGPRQMSINVTGTTR